MTYIDILISAVFTRSIVEDLSLGRSPVIYINRFRNYCTDASGNCCCSHDSAKGVEMITLQQECHARRFDILLQVLLIVQQLLQEHRHASKRDIYYMHPSVFRDIISVADYILVVEKESVFQRLANYCFCKNNHCIIITQLQSRYCVYFLNRFLRLLIDQLRLPAYCLVDCDPYGFDILTTYRFGSMASKQMAYDAKIMKLPEIKWLGVFPSDAERFNVPQQCLLPMTTQDKIKTEAILNRCYLQREVPHWRLELELLLQSGMKFEIEALSVHSLTLLSKQYLPSKIQGELLYA
ncbi:hypothetical protein R6Q59_018603 [Mikania micrantha]